MASVSVTTTMPVAAEEAWRVVRDFGGVGGWIPGIASVQTAGSGVGAVRTIVATNGERDVERLTELDDAQRTLSYTSVESTLSLAQKGYVATMQVRDLGDGRCDVVWSSTFDEQGMSRETVNELRDLLARNYAADLEALSQRLAVTRQEGA